MVSIVFFKEGFAIPVHFASGQRFFLNLAVAKGAFSLAREAKAGNNYAL